MTVEVDRELLRFSAAALAELHHVAPGRAADEKIAPAHDDAGGGDLLYRLESRDHAVADDHDLATVRQCHRVKEVAELVHPADAGAEYVVVGREARELDDIAIRLDQQIDRQRRAESISRKARPECKHVVIDQLARRTDLRLGGL